MNEEEKKAINDLIDIKEFGNLSNYLDLRKEQLNSIDIALYLIDKQQKEIKELKKPKYIINCETGSVTKIDNDFISKDKIRDKIKELEESIRIYNESSYYDNDYISRLKAQIIILQSLLKE